MSGDLHCYKNHYSPSHSCICNWSDVFLHSLDNYQRLSVSEFLNPINCIFFDFALSGHPPTLFSLKDCVYIATPFALQESGVIAQSPPSSQHFNGTPELRTCVSPSG